MTVSSSSTVDAGAATHTAAPQDMRTRFVAAWSTGSYQGEYFGFESPSALFRMLSPKRWELTEKLQAEGPMGVRALARALESDVRRVHDDAQTLIDVGLVEKDDNGTLRHPVITPEYLKKEIGE